MDIPLKVNREDGIIDNAEIGTKVQSDDKRTNDVGLCKTTTLSDTDMLYGIDDSPPWYATILFALQLLCQTIGSFVSMPLLLFMVICKDCPQELQYIMVQITSSNFLVSGISTLLQTGIGSRLPVEQAACSKTLIAVMSYISSKHIITNDTQGMLCSNVSSINLTNDCTTPTEAMESLAYGHLQEIQGGVILFGATEFLLGATGLVGVLMKLIGPITIAPTLVLIGVSLIGIMSKLCSAQWGIAALTASIVIISSLFMRNILVPFHYLKCSRNKGKRQLSRISCSHRVNRFPVFKTLPVAFAVAISWILCAILTITNVFPDDTDSPSYKARTDAKAVLVSETPWFRFPYPGQWGYPRFTIAAYATMLAAMFSSIIESIGDYYATARVCHLPPPPTHAINRGIAMEGIAGITAGIIGSGGSTTSYSNNVGLIGLTKVASRHITLCLGIILIGSSFISKLGAALTAVPDPVIGAVASVSLALVCGVGISALKHANMDLARNQCIVGIAILLGVLVPNWLSANTHAIDTGFATLDQALVAVLSNPIFIGAFTACFLDNITPGSLKDRGMISMRFEKSSSQSNIENGGTNMMKNERCTSYDIPFITGYLDTKTWSKYIPVFPQHKGWTINCCTKKTDEHKKTNESLIV